MALEISNQYLFTGRGPFDAKSLVKTYDDLLSGKTWLTDDGKSSAYNGMIVAVWLNKSDLSKNGVYYLHDSAITNTFSPPDVTNELNWHRLCDISALNDITSRLQTLEADLADVTARVHELEEKQNEVFAYRKLFPSEGVEGKIYVAVDEKKSYVWIESTGWLCVGAENEEPEVIYGGDSGV